MKHYTFIDYVTQGYLVVVGLLILLFHGVAVPGWPWLVGGHLLGMLLVHWLIQTYARHPENRSLDFLRHFYPVFLYIGFYRETGELNQMFASGFLDAPVIRLEERVFGTQPSLTFMENLPYLAVSELLYASYFSYYLMIAGVGLALYLRDRGQFFHYLSVNSFVFYVCYLVYIFVPVMGPRVFWQAIGGYELPADVRLEALAEFPVTVQAGPFFRIMAWIYRNLEASGAAFPSSHVAVALTTLYFSWRYLPRIRWVHFVMVVLLCLSTVYCRYHYVVDVVAGLFTAVLLLPLGNWLYFRFRRPAEVSLTAGLKATDRAV